MWFCYRIDKTNVFETLQNKRDSCYQRRDYCRCEDAPSGINGTRVVLSSTLF